MPNPTITSADVAREARVSRATVSAVINRTNFVSPPLVQRVEAAMRKLGYRHNALARSLKTKRTDTIGVVVPSVVAHFLAELIVAVEDALDQTGYRMFLCHSGESAERERHQLELLLERRVDGLVLVPTSDVNLALLRELVQGTPTVVLDRRLPELGVDTVATDNEAGGYQAAAHLASLGYRRLGGLSFDTAARSSRERLDGFRRVVRELGLSIPSEWIRVASFPLKRSVRQIAMELLTATPRPDALFVGDPMTLMHLWSVLDELAIRIPEDLALVSFDDFAWAAHLRPALTVVAQDATAIARQGVELLLERISGAVQRPPVEVVLPARLIVRESCGARLHRRQPRF